MARESNKFLKVTGILMIIGGSFGVIFGIIAVIGVGAAAALLGSEAKMGLLVLSSVLVLIGGIISLVAGIIGVKNAAIPEKAQTCIVFGILAAAVSVGGNLLKVAGGGKFNFLGILTGLVLPVLYLIGAYQNKSKIA
ncbi:MAG TPA: hypothetical protein VFD89_01710 [Clostridia bacterium]|nr:hypothetical protein [Clostridia bacterium]